MVRGVARRDKDGSRESVTANEATFRGAERIGGAVGRIESTSSALLKAAGGRHVEGRWASNLKASRDSRQWWECETKVWGDRVTTGE
jgi:hypothetical protein